MSEKSVADVSSSLRDCFFRACFFLRVLVDATSESNKGSSSVFENATSLS